MSVDSSFIVPSSRFHNDSKNSPHKRTSNGCNNERKYRRNTTIKCFASSGYYLKERPPVDVSGDNIYVAWTTNKTGNDEVMFRVSTDAGKTFGDKIKLSDSPDADSVNVKLGEDEGKLVITWWEHNQTSVEPVMKVSTDNGKTFGEKISLSAQGRIG